MAAKKKPMTEKEVSLVVQEAETEIQNLSSTAQEISKLNMESDTAYEKVLSEGRTVRDIERKIVKKQKWAVVALDEAKKRVKSLFIPMLNSCTEVLELVDKKQSEYFQIQDQKQEAEQEKLDAEALEEQKRLERNAKARAKRDPGHKREILGSVPEIVALEAEEVIAPKVDGVVRAKIWDYEITEPQEVPENVVLDDSAEFILWSRSFNRGALLGARKHCEELGMNEGEITVAIPWVRFFQKDSTRYRGGD